MKKMDEMEIKKVKVVDNPRKDFGNMEELTNSIKQVGVLEPLLVNKKRELIAGERRLRAAKVAGLEMVPVRVVDLKKDEIAEIKLIENIQRKNLNPIEEGSAFKNYMMDTGHDAQYLALKLGKNLNYITRRAGLIDLDPAVQKALTEKKIELGHAVIIGSMEKKDQKGAVTKIVDEEIPIKETMNWLDMEEVEIEDAPFDKKECKGCAHNGSSQQTLEDTNGSTKGQCLKLACFKKKCLAWVADEKKKLKEKGIVIMDLAEVKEIEYAMEIRDSSWDDGMKKKYDAVIKALNEKDNKFLKDYVIVINTERMPPTKEIYCIKKSVKKKESHAQEEKKAEALNLSRGEKLNSKIREYKQALFRKINLEKIQQGVIAKAMMMVHICTGVHICAGVPHTRYVDIHSESRKIMSVNYQPKMNNEKIQLEQYMGITSDQEEKMQLLWAKELIRWSSGIDYQEAVQELIGWKLENEWVIDADYLDLHTKDQLLDLAKEVKVGAVKENMKRSDMVAQFLREVVQKEIKGKVPKMLLNKKRS